MATPDKGGRKTTIRRSSSEDDDSFVYVFDRRYGDAPEVKIKTAGLFTFLDFKARVQEVLEIPNAEAFVITSTIREEINDDSTWDVVENGETLYVLKTISQELSAPAQERVNYLPHYDTIVKGGMYEYYASEGQNPLPYAFAELIDNALAATAFNTGQRKIELRLHFDDNTKRNSIYIVDNGKGMTPRQLNNWAIYRLSKFNRRERRRLKGDTDTEASFLADDSAPRSLNSDISYFGVGGKQAIFYIGSSTRMITKSLDSKDVHELMISKEEFEKKEQNHESIYSGFIRNRKPGDDRHISNNDETLRRLIQEEVGKESFTAVVIENVSPEHIPYLKLHLKEWTRQLAHIYHYYIHGPNGNVGDEDFRAGSPFKNIDIEVDSMSLPLLLKDVFWFEFYFQKVVVLKPARKRQKVHVYNGRNSGPPQVVSLREIHDDMQSLFVQNSAHSFEFKAIVEGSGIVEGILRYHPFLYDRETYPADANDPRMELEINEDHAYAFNDRPARGRRPIFECYWNGRLIPYTLIEEFEWCAPSKKNKSVPPECYNRVSGVLWTNDGFQVSTNKLTFIDLELKLRDKNTVFTRTVGGHDRRTAIDKEFTMWLKECHENHDKQVRFSAFKGQVTRADMPRHKQTPWSVFEQIQWDNKVFKKGSLIRVARTSPMVFGRVQRFLLYGDYKGEVFATGGDMEIIQEPSCLFDEVKIWPLSRLDRLASSSLVQRYLEEEETKFPDHLLVTWPEGMEVTANEKRRAGQTIGDIKVQIGNRKGELMNKLPGPTSATNPKKLLVELKITWHSPNGDEDMVSHICQHGKNWGYWFRRMDNIKNLGPHTLHIQAVLNESGAVMFAGKPLPSHKIKFTVIEGLPDKFTVGVLDGPFRVGVPFQIPLEFQDEFNHPTKPTADLKPVLTSSGLELSHTGTQIKGNSLLINGIIAKAAIGSSAGKSYSLTVQVPGIDEDKETLKIRLVPGPPASLRVSPEKKETEIENGNQVRFDVAVLDVMGNVTTENKLNVICKFSGAPGLPTYSVNCASQGQGHLTGEPICLSTVTENTSINAKIELQGHKAVPAVEKKIRILPSQRVADIKVHYLVDGEKVQIKNGATVTGAAGESVQGISFAVTDEAGRERVVDDKLVGLIKVNWTHRVNKSILLQGKLSDIKIPTSTSDSKFCQILFLDGSNVEFTFTVKAQPGEASQLKCKCTGKAQVRSGEVLASEIQVHIKDKFGNEITKFSDNPMEELEVTGDCVDTNNIVKKRGKNCAVVVQSVTFKEGLIGVQEIGFKYKELNDYVKVEVQAGPPAGISLPEWDLEQIFTVYNESKLPHPLVVQLVDKGGNPCHEADIRILLGKDTGVKFVPAPTPLRTDSLGRANFGVLTVSGKLGIYELQPKAFLAGKNVITGPKIRISLQPDPNRPVRLDLDYEERDSYEAGEKLTDFTVRVIGEDDNLMSSAMASHLTMKLWKVETGAQSEPPSRAISLNPDSKGKKNTPGVFQFTNISLPSVSGMHNIMCVYYDGKYDLYSTVIEVNIVPSKVMKLSPLENPGTPTVSNTRSAASRCLIRHLELEIRDQFDNPCISDISGKVNLTINSNDGSTDVPVFVGGNSSLEIPLTSGKATLQNICIQENSAGKDGEEYQLTCTVVNPNNDLKNPVPPLVIPFLFYNDARKQTQMAALSKERDSLQMALKTYKSLFDTTDQLIMELKISVHDASQEEQRLKAELRKLGVPASQLSTAQNIETLIKNRTNEKRDMLERPRRKCGLTPAVASSEVVGKIGHLANIADPAIARVLSWHMSGDMDCVVTSTTKKAKEIYHQTAGRQQVLPLDSIYKKNLPDWRKPLPHLRHLPSLRPSGNPVYARNLLEFTLPEREGECKMVFGMLLGDVLILDTIEDATNYRQEVVKFTHCPTILTRDGDRIRSNGKFGGQMNRALPIEKLRGAVFGEPLPAEYSSVSAQIELLEAYKEAHSKHQTAKQELEEQQQCKTAPEMKSKYQECKEVEKQLTDIEQKLFGMSQSRLSTGMSTPPRPRPRLAQQSTASKPAQTARDIPESDPSPSKRPRMSPRVSVVTPSQSASNVVTVNGSSEANTPRRQSRRIATSPRATDPRKRKRTP